MTAEQFFLIQQYLVQAYWPFVQVWMIAFMVAGILVAILILFLIVSRELLTRAT